MNVGLQKIFTNVIVYHIQSSSNYNVIIGNLKEESENGIGREWKYDNNITNSLYIHKSIALAQNLYVGDPVVLNFKKRYFILIQIIK